MMTGRITLGRGGAGVVLEVCGVTAAEIGLPLVELRIDILGAPLNLTVDQAEAIAAALQLGARRARGEPMETELDRLLATRKPQERPAP